MKKTNSKIIITLLILLVGFILRSYQVGQNHLIGDESISIIRSIWIIKFFTSHDLNSLYGLVAHTHPPLELILPIPFILTGLTEFKARFAAILIGSLTPLIFIYLYRKWFSPKALFLSALVIAASPFAIGWSRLASFPAYHMAYSLFVLWSLASLYEKNDTKRLTVLAIVYGFSFWIMLDYIILLPLVIWLILKYLKANNVKKFVIPALIFCLISGSFLIPYILLGLKFAPKTMGINYNFGRSFESNILNNLNYYTSSFILHWSVVPFLIVAIIKLFQKKVKHSKIWIMSVLYISCYLIFYVLIYGKNQAYLYGIYMPVIVAGSISAFKIFKKSFPLFVISIIILALSMLFKFYSNGASDTSAIWGFYNYPNITKSAYIIRSCTPIGSYVISDLDGFQTSLYFNRKYYPEQDTNGIKFVLNNLASQSGAIFVNNELKLNTECDVKTGGFYKKYWNINSTIDFYR